ncbi:MAG TPA: response regulator transcription factor [Sandaracinaceae bacterium LLY-WYZ-13_1]|nr:response regulator transcription factor [Sandaracinaceae bacterium LLY-WYZ-13_1]
MVGPGKTSIRVAIVDDHLVVRDSVAHWLERHDDIRVVGLASGLEEGRLSIRRTTPDVVLVDLDLPDGDGMSLVEQLSNEPCDTRCVAFTGTASSADLSRLLRLGGGFVSKSASPQQVLEAIRDAFAGKTPIHASFEHESAAAVALTPRELEVLRLVAEGFSSKEAASHLEVSPATVDTHRHRIAKKLGLRHRWQLVRYALDHGILR